MSEPLTITAAAPLIRTGELTPSELLEQCLRRIDIYEPAVKAWAYLDRERARQEAAKATDEIKAGHYRGPLHGIPVGIKDIIDVYDMPTGCGSKLWANSYARQDATCVERLRQAGAIILGKTVTTAYAYLDPPVTRNPWNLDRTPGGSSSGSAAAVACGMCLASLGTQTGGSVIRPASYCGVYALKPTWGRVSVNGVLPLAPSLDHIGVMANCVRDLFLVYRELDRVHRTDAQDPLDREHLDLVFASQEILLPPPRLKPQKLVLDPSLITGVCDADVGGAFGNFLVALVEGSGHGLELYTGTLPAEFHRVRGRHYTLMAVEAAMTHRERFARHPDDYPPRIAELIDHGLRADPMLVTEVSRRDSRWDFGHEVARHLDGGLLITPATTTLPPTAETTGSPVMNSPWSHLGFPVVSLPIRETADGLFVSVQLIGSWRDDDLRVLSAAAVLEEFVVIPRRLPPVPAVT